MTDSDSRLDRIFIKGLSVDAIIGVFEWEQKVHQPLIFDIEMAWDIAAAAATDDLNQTLDYGAVALRVELFVAAIRVQLLETLVVELADCLMAEFGIPWISIRVEKPAVLPQTRAVGVQIERGRL